MQINCFKKKIVFVGVLIVSDENSRIRVHTKCHGSATLVKIFEGPFDEFLTWIEGSLEARALANMLVCK